MGDASQWAWKHWLASRTLPFASRHMWSWHVSMHLQGILLYGTEIGLSLCSEVDIQSIDFSLDLVKWS